jgi:hypothetical protein
MAMIEYNDFYNDGFGYICKRCERETQANQQVSEDKRSRIMREGETESKQPNFSNTALAKWLDKLQTTLICPNCGITEKVD